MNDIPPISAHQSPQVQSADDRARSISPIASVPQKRAFEEDHQPSIPSPLNPEFPRQRDDAPAARDRAARAKKESFKKRELKGPNGATESRATPDPKSPSKQRPSEPHLAPMRYKLATPKIADFSVPQGPTFIPHHSIDGPDGQRIEFQEAQDHVFNKKNFRYTHCIADPTFPSSQYYRQSEVEPFGPHLNFEDQPTSMYMDKSAKHVTTDKGFRMTKANVCVREGRYYWECKITSGIPKKGRNSKGHVRMGWARREATLEAICGFDAYSYGLRDVGGQKVHLSRPQDFFPKGENIEVGDVIGLEINLPSEKLHRKVVEGCYNPAVDLLEDDNPTSLDAADIIRDRVPILYKSHLYFEQVEYHTVKELEDLLSPVPIMSSSGIAAAPQSPRPTHPIPALRTLPGSSIKVYKNGVYMGEAFRDLLAFLPPASKPLLGQPGVRDGLDDGMLGYYPAVSVFRGGAAEINLGPDFWFPPPGSDPEDDEVDMVGSDQPPLMKNGPKPVSDRYDEQIVEDIVHDIIDEVDFWVQDGYALPKNLHIRTTLASQEGVADGDIKELVQDEE